MAYDSGEVTRLLNAIRAGDSAARDRLVEIVYARLHDMAAGYLAREPAGHSFEPTDLLHETLLKIMHGEIVHDATNRAYFFGAASIAMRRLLAERARQRRAIKRGGDHERLPLDDAIIAFEDRQIDLVVARDALDALAARHERASEVLTLRLLGGFTAAEVADHLGVSLATVEKDTRFARAWLQQHMGDSADGLR